MPVAGPDEEDRGAAVVRPSRYRRRWSFLGGRLVMETQVWSAVWGSMDGGAQKGQTGKMAGRLALTSHAASQDGPAQSSRLQGGPSWLCIRALRPNRAYRASDKDHHRPRATHTLPHTPAHTLTHSPTPTVPLPHHQASSSGPVTTHHLTSPRLNLTSARRQPPCCPSTPCWLTAADAAAALLAL